MSEIEALIRRIVREEIAAQRPVVPRFEAKSIQRTGCTCHPGRQTSCPDPTCPWKSR